MGQTTNQMALEFFCKLMEEWKDSRKRKKMITGAVIVILATLLGAALGVTAYYNGWLG